MPEIIAKLLPEVGILSAIDVAIVAFVIYQVINFVRETRAEQLLKGLLFLLVAYVVSKYIKLYTLTWIFERVFTVALFALVVVFQPELRRGLEFIGRNNLISRQFSPLDKDKAKKLTSILVKTVDHFSADKTGALIILEREITLSDIVETGTTIDAELSVELLGNIFYEGAPLHDGALIIRGDRAVAAGCVLPLTQDKELNKELGTRHRAGIGITEYSDAVALIVSEESGIISIAQDGKLSRFLDLKTVEKTLLGIYLDQLSEGQKKKSFTDWVPFFGNGSKKEDDGNDQQQNPE